MPSQQTLNKRLTMAFKGFLSYCAKFHTDQLKYCYKTSVFAVYSNPVSPHLDACISPATKTLPINRQMKGPAFAASPSLGV